MDENLKEFWVDFNLGSHSISFYFSLAGEDAQVQHIIFDDKKNALFTYLIKPVWFSLIVDEQVGNDMHH